MDNIFDNFVIAYLKNNSYCSDILIHLNEKSPSMLKYASKTCEYILLTKNDYFKIGIEFNKEIVEILESPIEFLENLEKMKTVIIALFDQGKNTKEIKKS